VNGFVGEPEVIHLHMSSPPYGVEPRDIRDQKMVVRRQVVDLAAVWLYYSLEAIVHISFTSYLPCQLRLSRTWTKRLPTPIAKHYTKLRN
jgi:hypothetical protein